MNNFMYREKINPINFFLDKKPEMYYWYPNVNESNFLCRWFYEQDERRSILLKHEDKRLLNRPLALKRNMVYRPWFCGYIVSLVWQTHAVFVSLRICARLPSTSTNRLCPSLSWQCRTVYIAWPKLSGTATRMESPPAKIASRWEGDLYAISFETIQIIIRN